MSERNWWRNLARELFCYIIPLIGVALIWRYIRVQFTPIGSKDSVNEFLVSIIAMWGITFLLTLVWWRIATVRMRSLAPVRRFLEQYSFQCSLVLAALAFVVALVFYGQNHFIIAKDQNSRYPVSCIFVIPLLFSMMLYALPPRQISRVILPGPSRGLRFALSFLLLGAAFANFGVNFLW